MSNLENLIKEEAALPTYFESDPVTQAHEEDIWELYHTAKAAFARILPIGLERGWYPHRVAETAFIYAKAFIETAAIEEAQMKKQWEEEDSKEGENPSP